MVLLGEYKIERTDCTAEASAVEGLLLSKNTFEPGWFRSCISSRSLGIGKLGFGCGRVESAVISGEERRTGTGIGEGVGFDDAAD